MWISIGFHCHICNYLLLMKCTRLQSYTWSHTNFEKEWFSVQNLINICIVSNQEYFVILIRWVGSYSVTSLVMNSKTKTFWIHSFFQQVGCANNGFLYKSKLWLFVRPTQMIWWSWRDKVICSAGIQGSFFWFENNRFSVQLVFVFAGIIIMQVRKFVKRGQLSASTALTEWLQANHWVYFVY